MSDTSALRCQGLIKRFGSVTAVDGLDLEVRRGECLGLLGPNGAGKTTTVEILEGLTPPDAGEVQVLGQRWGTGQDHALRGRIGIQLQETRLSKKLTVAETIDLFRSFYPRPRSLDALIEALALDEKRHARVQTLSGGQQQRVALACSLAGDPEVLFLDEPTTGLDPQARLRIWEVVEAFRARGGTVLLTTHYMEEAARLCDRVAIVDRGRVVACDTPTALIAGLGGEQILELTAAGLTREDLIGLEGVVDVTQRDGHWMLTVAPGPGAIMRLLGTVERRGVSISALVTHQATLEDVFVALTGRGLRDE